MKINNKTSSVIFKGDEKPHVLNKLVSTDDIHFSLPIHFLPIIALSTFPLEKVIDDLQISKSTSCVQSSL